MKNDIITKLKHGLIVSCQALADEPHYLEGIIQMYAKCAELSGAVALRIDTPENVKEVKKVCDLPIIGIYKIDKGINDVYLTPNIDAVDSIVNAGAEIIAVQTTNHIRKDNKLSYEIINEIKSKYKDIIIFADCETTEDAIKATELGVDFIAPTLRTYFNKSYKDKFDVLKEFVEVTRNTDVKVIMEGGITTPSEAKKAIELGAYSVVVGNAITRPHKAIEFFVREIEEIK